MNLRNSFISAWFLALVFGLCLGTSSAALADEAKFEAQLVWATTDQHAPNEDYKPVDAETQKKLESLGLKWKKFYLVKKQAFATKNKESGKVELDKSSITVKLVDDTRVEVVFYGQKGKECSRRNQPLNIGEMLSFGGNVPEKDTAWLITLKRIK
jgi:hypothetical protein